MMIAWLIIAVAVGIGLAVAIVAYAKGRSFLLWWVYGSLLGVIAVPHVLLLGDGRAARSWRPDRFGLPDRERTCPHCGAIVHAETLVCRYCRRAVYEADPTPAEGTPERAGRASAAPKAAPEPAFSALKEPPNDGAFAWLDSAFARVSAETRGPQSAQWRAADTAEGKAAASAAPNGEPAASAERASPHAASADPDKESKERVAEAPAYERSGRGGGRRFAKAPEPPEGWGQSPGFGTAEPDKAERKAGREAWSATGFSPAPHDRIFGDDSRPAGARTVPRAAAVVLVAALMLVLTWYTVPDLSKLLGSSTSDRWPDRAGGAERPVALAPGSPGAERRDGAPPPESRPDAAAGSKEDDQPASTGTAPEDRAVPRQGAAPKAEEKVEEKVAEPAPPAAAPAPVQERARPAPESDIALAAPAVVRAVPKAEPPPAGDGDKAASPPAKGTRTPGEFIAIVQKALQEHGGRRGADGTDTGVTASGELVAIVQQELRHRGYDPGSLDGRAGPRTQTAIRAFQRDVGMQPDGIIDITLLQRLGIVGEQIHVFGN